MRVARLWVWAWCGAFALLAAVGTADGQQAKRRVERQESKKVDRPAPWDLWPTAKMIDLASEQIGRRYNLTEDQNSYTRALMSQRVNRFLVEHEAEVRALLKEAWTARLKGEAPSVETAKTWAQRGLPIFEAAKREILEGNKEWREVLDEKQRKIHDVDMRVMERNFDITKKRMDRWGGGGFDSEKDWYRGGLVGALTGQQSTTRPSRRGRVGPSAGGVVRSEDYWEQYVRQFIKNYSLDESQSQAARSILSECKQRAGEYRQGRKEQFEKANSKVREVLAKRPGDAVTIRAAYGDLRALNKPINELFKELKRRLEEIPTAAQKKSYKEVREARLAKLRGQWQEKRRRMGVRATTKPTTQAAEASEPTATAPAGE